MMLADDFLPILVQDSVAVAVDTKTRILTLPGVNSINPLYLKFLSGNHGAIPISAETHVLETTIPDFNIGSENLYLGGKQAHIPLYNVLKGNAKGDIFLTTSFARTFFTTLQGVYQSNNFSKYGGFLPSEKSRPYCPSVRAIACPAGTAGNPRITRVLSVQTPDVDFIRFYCFVYLLSGTTSASNRWNIYCEGLEHWRDVRFPVVGHINDYVPMIGVTRGKKQLEVYFVNSSVTFSVTVSAMLMGYTIP